MIDKNSRDQYYNDRIDEISKQYLSLSFEQVHNSWMHLLPNIFQHQNLSILDVGAGTGRDIRYLEKVAGSNDSKSKQFIAAEPAQEMLNVGKELTKHQNISWYQDSLPLLNKVTRLSTTFDLILLSAVWMHILPVDREASLQTLKGLLSDNGLIILILKRGATDIELRERYMFEVDIDELILLSRNAGFCVQVIDTKAPDELGRTNIYWQTLLLS